MELQERSKSQDQAAIAIGTTIGIAIGIGIAIAAGATATARYSKQLVRTARPTVGDVIFFGPDCPYGPTRPKRSKKPHDRSLF